MAGDMAGKVTGEFEENGHVHQGIFLYFGEWKAGIAAFVRGGEARQKGSKRHRITMQMKKGILIGQGIRCPASLPGEFIPECEPIVKRPHNEGDAAAESDPTSTTFPFFQRYVQLPVMVMYSTRFPHEEGIIVFAFADLKCAQCQRPAEIIR